MKKSGNYLWGIVFIAIGVIWGLNATGITNINLFFNGWWTLFIIIPSLIGIVKTPDKTTNFITLVIGILLFLCIQGVISFSLIRNLLLPLILVIIGCSILFKDAINKKINDKIKKLNKEGLQDYIAVFSGQEAKIQNEEFKGANVEAIFGGVELNLKEAIINGEQVINATSIFGGIDILLPPDVRVEIKSTQIFGGVSNETKSPESQDVPTIYVNALSLFGGIDIK